jgi:8-oxo-dGTP pyrophosphatase MutT (NUDIX family)
MPAPPQHDDAPRPATDRALSPLLRDRMSSHLAGFERRAAPLEGRRAAAVTLLLVEGNAGEACFVLTRRAPKLRSHGGQWALPGGRLDPGEDAVAAALRESEEEVGAVCDETHVLGLLDDYPTRSGYVITPVVVWAGAGARLAANPAEVAELHRVPVAELEAPEVPRLRTIPESDRPVISVPIVGVQVHAPTAAILFQFRELALQGRHTRVDHYEQPVFAWR